MSEFGTLVVVAVLAFLAPGLARRLHMPVVVGEIALGLLVGFAAYSLNHFLGEPLLATGEAMDFLAEIGFIILLFLAGLEIDFNMIEERGVAPIVIAFAVFLFMLGLSWAIADRLGYGFFTALILTTTSIGVVVPTLREMRLSITDYGQNVLITALIIDFGTMILLTIYVFIVEGGAPGGTTASWLPFLLIILFFVIFYLVYRVGGIIMWHYPALLSKFFRSEDPTEGGVRASLALMFTFVGLSVLLGVEAILGAFLAGMMISLLFREGSLLEEKLYGIGYGFFVPVFFINLGLTFDFEAAADPAIFVVLALFLGVLLFIKLIPHALWIPRYGVRRVAAMGFLNASGLTLMIAAATVGLRMGFIDDVFFAAVLILAMGTAALGPVLFRLLMRNDPLLAELAEPPEEEGDPFA